MHNQLQNIVLLIILVGVLAVAGCDQQNQPTTQEQQAEETATTNSGNSKKSQTANSQSSRGQDWSEPQAAAEPEPSCANCGRITAVEPVAKKGEASGIGVVAGGVAGGIIGNQIGDGTGKKIATVAGAIGGAVAGNEVEKYVKAEKYYAVTVDMDNGGTQTVKIANGQSLSVGDRVKVDGNNLYLQ